ncbi:Transcriptional regulatory protein QseB [Burkholderia glumae]|nr:Transcriptional regulatory protein QseB [Burkholderia glumae]
MSKILTIEDDVLIADSITRQLQAEGHTVDLARTGRDGIAKVMAGDYDAVTLDRMLPDLDGLAILATMRGVGLDTPVLVMSAMSEVDQRIAGLRAGGDDYLVKPFSLAEMVARLEVLMRRRPRSAHADTVLRAGGIELDLVRRRASLGARELQLLPTEFRVLEFMMRHAGRVLTRTMIFEGYGAAGSIPAPT